MFWDGDEAACFVLYFVLAGYFGAISFWASSGAQRGSIFVRLGDQLCVIFVKSNGNKLSTHVADHTQAINLPLVAAEHGISYAVDGRPCRILLF